MNSTLLHCLFEFRLYINGGIRFFDKSKADNPDIEEIQNDRRK